MKAVDSLTVADLEAFPVWQYTGIDHPDETYVRPVRRVPVASLGGKVVGTQATLANVNRVWAVIGNLFPNSIEKTEHFLTISVERGGHWFTLARYHDFDYFERGARELAKFLDIDVDEVFPITYDIRHLVKGEGAALRGLILREPRERLSQEELIAMAVP
jgi:hypothetical protein